MDCLACFLIAFSFKQGKTVADLVSFIDTARIPTAQRISTLEAETETLRTQLAEAARRKPAKSGGVAAEEEEDDDPKAEAAERQREQEELKSVPNPINEYVEMLEEEVCLMSPLSLHRKKLAEGPCTLPTWSWRPTRLCKQSAHNNETVIVMPCIAMT